MVEDLDHLLAVYHLFDIAVQGSQGRLLFHKVFRAAAADLHRGLQHQEGPRDDQQRQPQAAAQHRDKHHRQRNDGGDALGQHLADHLAQRIGVVGIVAHDLAVGMRVKVADRQGLHVREQLVPHLPQHALADDRHDARLREGRNDPQHKQDRHLQHGCRQAGLLQGEVVPQRRDNMVVDDRAHEPRRQGGGQGVQHDTHQHHQQAGPVRLQVTHQAHQGFFVQRLAGAHAAGAAGTAAHGGGLCLRGGVFPFTHGPRLPSSGNHALRGRSRSAPAAPPRAFRCPRSFRCPAQRSGRRPARMPPAAR